MRPLVMLAALAALTGIPSTTHAQARDTSSAVLRPGDLVKITVWRKPELSGEFSIASTGVIADPFYSAVSVAGLPLGTATERIQQYVGQIEASPRVWVEPLFRVTVGGEVRTPNLYSLTRETTIAQAVALAGGPGEVGRLDQVTLIRGGQAQLIDLTNPAGQWSSAPIRSGDQILLGRRTSVWREVVAPASAVIAALGTIANLFLR